MGEGNYRDGDVRYIVHRLWEVGYRDVRRDMGLYRCESYERCYIDVGERGYIVYGMWEMLYRCKSDVGVVYIWDIWVMGYIDVIDVGIYMLYRLKRYGMWDI